VKIEVSKESGRYMRASEDIVPGETIVEEFPYAAVLLRQHERERCHHCFLKTFSFIP
jgi:hypothetical protein